jgi:hypothetical protein
MGWSEQNPDNLFRFFTSSPKEGGKGMIDYDLVLSYSRKKLSGEIQLQPGDIFGDGFGRNLYFIRYADSMLSKFVCLAGNDKNRESLREFIMNLEDLNKIAVHENGFIEFEYLGNYPQQMSELHDKFRASQKP